MGAFQNKIKEMKSRMIFSDLVREYRQLKDDYDKAEVVFKLATLGDSRALIFLTKQYEIEDFEMKKKILMALKDLRDPRSICFLEEILREKNDSFLKKLASDAICSRNLDYEYEFCGPERLYWGAQNKKGYVIRNYRDLLGIRSCLKEDLEWESFKPQAYVIIDNQLILGGELDEHVEVASGRRVMAAGEAGFIYTGNWIINYLNNRSYGYLPARSSENIVVDVLDKTKIINPRRFNESFPRDGFTREYLLGLDENY